MLTLSRNLFLCSLMVALSGSALLNSTIVYAATSNSDFAVTSVSVGNAGVIGDNELGHSQESKPLERAVPDETPHSEKKRKLTSFFVIGMIINVTMLFAFFVWAIKQWKLK